MTHDPDMTVTEITTLTTDRVRRNVAALMAIYRVSQQKLAKQIDMSRPTIQKRLADGQWKVEELGRLAVYFQVPESVLFSDPDDLFKTLSDLGFRPPTWTSAWAVQMPLLLAS
jgi:hypothetical protein